MRDRVRLSRRPHGDSHEQTRARGVKRAQVLDDRDCPTPIRALAAATLGNAHWCAAWQAMPASGRSLPCRASIDVVAQ